MDSVFPTLGVPTDHVDLVVMARVQIGGLAQMGLELLFRTEIVEQARENRWAPSAAANSSGDPVIRRSIIHPFTIRSSKSGIGINPVAI